MQPGFALPLPTKDIEPDPSDLNEAAEPAEPEAPPAQYFSSCKWTPKQVENFESETLTRIEELRREMGLSQTNDVMPGSWMWLRRCHEQYYQGDLSWRLAFGGIFSKSNITLGSGIKHVRYNYARMSDDLLGTQPFMAALAAKQSKEELAKQVDNYIQGEIESSDVRNGLREAQKIALYRNECVVKLGYELDKTPFIGPATVLVDRATGEPIKTPHSQQYIFKDDNFLPHPKIQDAGMLEKDPSFIIFPNPEAGVVSIPADADTPERTADYQDVPDLAQEAVHREGVYAMPLDHRAFLCPLKVDDIHKADTNVHLYLESPKRLNEIYGGIDVSQGYFSWYDRPGQDKAKFEQGEGDMPTTAIYQQVVVAEVYRRCDPDETGREKEILAVFDFTNRKLIYYNYLSNHMKKRPFECLPGLERIPGRWYGRGVYGMLDSHLFYEDVEASRSFYKNSKDATITFAYQGANDEWINGVAPSIGTDEITWIKSDWNPEGKPIKPMWRENLAENINPDQELQNVMRTSADSLVGAISVASANESGFNQSKTATGNQLVQQSADVIIRSAEEEQGAPIDRALGQVVDILLEHMDPVVLSADPDTSLVATINREEARSLTKDVRLLRTRSKSTQLLNTSAQALDLVDKHYQMMQTNLKFAKLRRPLVIAQLKGLEVQDADELVPEITDDDVTQWEQQQQGAQGKPPSESISAKLGDFVGNEIPQVLGKLGINADMQARQQAQAAESAQAAADTVAKASQQNKVVAMPAQ